MLTLDKFEEASEKVKEVTLETKLIYSDFLSDQTGNKVYLKPENMQFTGEKDYFEKIAQYVDCFLFDYKATGEEKHIYLTGVSNKEILNNLLLLTKMKKKVILRCPIIPGQNLSEDHLKAIADLSNKGVHSVEIIPYHNMGVAKAKKIGSGMYLSNVKIPRADDVENWIEKIKKYGGINIKKS